MQQQLIVDEENRGVENVNLKLESYKKNAYLTHNFHPYPAKFIPQIPKELILRLSKPNDLVLDPFCGSGTTLVEAKLNGRNGIGVDINPLSCLISKVKTTPLSLEEIEIINQTVKEIRKDTLAKKSYDVPKYLNIDLWFERTIQIELSIIKHHINLVQSKNARDFLSSAFSAIIVRASNQDSDTRYASVKKKREENSVLKIFEDKIRNMLMRMDEYTARATSCSSEVYNADSRELDFIKKKIDLVITSPPYLNSYDYYLYHKHRMLWLGLDYRTAQEKEFGSRNKHSDKNEGIEQYTETMRDIVTGIAKHLKKDGYFCIVIGDAILKGKLLRMNKIMDDIFTQAGYKKVKEIVFDQRKYTRTFTPNLKQQQKNSYVLVYQL